MDPDTLNFLKVHKFGIYKYKTRKYYDYPDGQDLIGKLWSTNSICGLLGIFLGSSKCVSYPPVKGFTPKLFVIAKITTPFLAAASAFTLTTYFSTNFRKVDDHLNHFFGGMAAGIPVGVLTGRIEFGLLAGIIIGAYAAHFKSMKMDGRDVFPTILARETFSSYGLRFRDFSLKERKRDSTKELPLPESEN